MNFIISHTIVNINISFGGLTKIYASFIRVPKMLTLDLYALAGRAFFFLAWKKNQKHAVTSPRTKTALTMIFDGAKIIPD